MSTTTTSQSYTESDVESRVGMTRLEEGLKHLSEKMAEGFERLEHTMTKRDTKHEALEARVSTSEKRIDKIYWLGTLLVAVGAPVMTLLTFGVKHMLGW